jgi:NAD(P)H-dependent FMN reductase
LRKEPLQHQARARFSKTGAGRRYRASIDSSALPLMNEDREKDLPQPVKDLHRSIDEANPATVTRTRI